MTNSSDVSGYIFVVGGPCGCGKSSVGQTLGDLLSVPFVEGDDLHPKENVAKMSQGIPLTDDDRWGWLKQIAATGFLKLTVSPAHGDVKYSVVGCLSLKKIYRDLIVSEVESKDPKVRVVFIFLNISIEMSRIRVAMRKNHYMKPNMVNSQFEILETPKGPELLTTGSANTANAIVIDPQTKTKKEIMDEVVQRLKELNIV